ncbi:protein of unknown function [Terribacillus aidingensis]|uniref:DUF5068 domain-containing protein n=1 Tax=Terribacillus aidingensis TaxID=586416 RepID=A0A285P254_9BACI|nr:DUF5068 domain-containing protein [Terribacillus aidingensis]SNZ14236.1 protein of unknown function [Terribacillus aidingensis]
MNNKWMLLLGALLAVFIIGGCGSDSKEASADEEKNSAEKTAASENNEDEPKEKTEDTKAATFPELIDYMKTTTDAEETKVFYEHTEPQTHEMEGVTVSLDAYSLVGIKDFHTDFSIPFDDETSGAVILAKYTVKNDSDKEIFYMPRFDLSYSSGLVYNSDYKELLPEDQQLFEKINPDTKYAIKAGESVTGFVAYPFGTAELETVMSEGSALIEVRAAQAKADDFDNPIGKDGKFTINFDEEGAEKTESNKEFYQDAVSIENMGDKQMIDQKEDVGESKELGDATITLDGYQFTEFKPNEIEAPRFENFKNGIVLLTVKFNVDNKGSANIALDNLRSNLYVNDGAQYQMNEGMLSPHEFGEVASAGGTADLFQVYVLDKEQYDKIWKDKAFDIELGPLYDDNVKDVSKGKKAEFKLK